MFDDEKAIQQGAEIVKALLEAQSPRLGNISEKMPGKGESNYKAIQRVLESGYETASPALPPRRSKIHAKLLSPAVSAAYAALGDLITYGEGGASLHGG